MTGYAKDWTDKYSDSWYIGLRLNERGIFDQLKTYAKLHGGTGKIFLRNFSHGATEWGCDVATCKKILRKIANDKRIKLLERENGIEIFIYNYHYWQHVKRVGDEGKNLKSPRKVREKSSLILVEKSRVEKSRVESDKMSNFDKAWDSLKEDKKLEQYSARSIDLDAQRFKMVNWVGENPAKKSYRRFIINWLNGALGNKPDGTDKAKEAFLARSED